MTKKKTRAPATVPALKLPVEELAAPTPDANTKIPEPTQSVAMVETLSQNAFKLIMQIIDNADFKGREVSQVLAIKLELVRVAGLRTTGDGQ